MQLKLDNVVFRGPQGCFYLKTVVILA